MFAVPAAMAARPELGGVAFGYGCATSARTPPYGCEIWSRAAHMIVRLLRFWGVTLVLWTVYVLAESAYPGIIDVVLYDTLARGRQLVGWLAAYGWDY